MGAGRDKLGNSGLETSCRYLERVVSQAIWGRFKSLTDRGGHELGVHNERHGQDSTRVYSLGPKGNSSLERSLEDIVCKGWQGTWRARPRRACLRAFMVQVRGRWHHPKGAKGSER